MEGAKKGEGDTINNDGDEKADDEQLRHNSNSSSNSQASGHSSNNNTNNHHPPHPGAVASRFSPPLQNLQLLPDRHLAAGGRAAHPLQAVQQNNNSSNSRLTSFACTTLSPLSSVIPQSPAAPGGPTVLVAPHRW